MLPASAEVSVTPTPPRAQFLDIVGRRLLNKVFDLAARAVLILYRLRYAFGDIVQWPAEDFAHVAERDGVSPTLREAGGYPPRSRIIEAACGPTVLG